MPDTNGGGSREPRREEIQEWADRFGSGRLHQALLDGELPVRRYLEERGQVELPGFEIDFDGSPEAEPVPDPDEGAEHALASLREYLGFGQIAHESCEVVRHRSDHGGFTLAIRLRGWELGHTLIGDIASSDGTIQIDDSYPWGVAGKGDSPLRGTAYGSAYGFRHPAAQEALRTAAIVVVDQIADNGIYELEEYLPPDAHDLIDDGLVGDFADTAYLVGWKFGQAHRHPLSNLAEQIVGHMILGFADVVFDQREGGVPDEGLDQARGEFEDCRESILDEIFLHEYLPSVDAYKLADMVPSGIENRRASLWAPWGPRADDPPPRATGDDEPDWSLSDPPGLTARESVAVSEAERSEEKAREREDLAGRLAELSWRLEFHGGDPYLLADDPSGKVVCISPPPPLAGPQRVAHWAWAYGRYASRDEAIDPEVDPEERETYDWAEFFEVFPRARHPLAVDAVFHTVDYTTEWVSSVVGHALPGGSVTPFEQSVKVLEGLVAIRKELESCRSAGLVDDARLTRRGIRHEQFGDDARMRFLAEARFAPPSGFSFADVQADFNQTIYDFSPLPVSLGVDPHPEEDGSVMIRCAMGVDSVEEADALANEVISQVRWRVGLRPIDLDEGEAVDEVGFRIIDLDSNADPDTDADK